MAGQTAPVTLTQIRGLLLAVGVMVESCELSSCLAKLHRVGEVKRTKAPRACGQGRRMVWAYEVAT